MKVGVMALCALTGCSWLVTNGRPNPLPARGPVECGRALAVTELVIGLSFLVSGVILATREPGGRGRIDARALAPYPLGAGAVLGLSGTVGLTKASGCEDAAEEVAAADRERDRRQHEQWKRAQQQERERVEQTRRLTSADQQALDRALENRRKAAALIDSASAAARNKDCAAVETLATQARATDPLFYDTVFVREPDIARCLAETQAP